MIFPGPPPHHPKFNEGGVQNGVVSKTTLKQMSSPHAIGPPLKTSYHLKGVWNSTYPQKNRFSQISPIFACSACHLPKSIPGEKKLILRNWESFFSITRWRTKTSLIFCIGSMSTENQSHLRGPFFQLFIFLLQSWFCGSCYSQMEETLEKPKEVFV